MKLNKLEESGALNSFHSWKNQSWNKKKSIDELIEIAEINVKKWGFYLSKLKTLRRYKDE